MAVIKQEWKWHLKLLRGWLIAIVLTIAVFMSFFPSFNEGMNDLIDMLHSFPVEFLRGFGLDIESFGTYSGFLAYIYTFIPVSYTHLQVDISPIAKVQIIGETLPDFNHGRLPEQIQYG